MSMNIWHETDELYEVWDGEKKMMSPSSPRHEMVLSRIHFQLFSFVLECRAGELFMSNTPIYLHPERQPADFVMPDLSFVAKERKHIVRTNGIFGPPDLIVEVISPGLQNTRRDMLDKFAKYERSGVAEYWLVDPYGNDIEMYALTEGRYAKVDGSVLFPGLRLQKDFLFAEGFADDA